MFKIIVLGQGQALISAIEGISTTNSQIVGVLNWDDTKKFNIAKYFKHNPVNELLKIKKLHAIKAKNTNNEAFKQEILKLNPDIIFVVTWGEKLKEETIRLAKIATINIHPSLLPKYRGPNPYSRVLMNGETKTGITFHLMDKNFDSGAILLQKEVKISEIDNHTSLKIKLCNEIIPSIAELLKKLDNEIIEPIEQDENEATYFSHATQEEIIIHPERESSKEISNKIRGLEPIQSCYIEYEGEFLRITKWEISDTHKECSLSFKTADNKFLLLSNPQVYGGFKKYFSKIILKFLLLNKQIQ